MVKGFKMLSHKPKGLPKTGGRQKGTSNKVTRELKDLIRGALDQAGGQDYLYSQALENPTAFLGLIGKILPQKIEMYTVIEQVKEMSDDDIVKRLQGLEHDFRAVIPFTTELLSHQRTH